MKENINIFDKRKCVLLGDGEKRKYLGLIPLNLYEGVSKVSFASHLNIFYLKIKI